MTRLPPRLALAFETHGWKVVAVVVVLGVAGVGLGASDLAHTERTTVTDHENLQTVSLNASSSATVTGNSTLFARGTELVDRPYPIDSAPNAAVVVVTETSAATRLYYNHSLALRYEITRGEERVWSETRVVAAENGSVDDRARTTATVSVRDVRDRLAELRTEAGSRARVSVTLVVRTAYETDRYRGRLTRTTALGLGDRWYSVESVDADRQHSTTEKRRVPVDDASTDAWALAIAGGALLAVGVLGGVAKRRFDPGDEDALRHRVHERRYDDWISAGHVPASFDRRVVTMASLADLAELAIDRQRRVVFDDSRQAYVVFDADVVYYYEEFWTEHDPKDAID
ncbi:DUF5305 family protein [Halorubellus sp. PRR65]|uniref:DUF5305 family protein n=1 Tax=Halorubellus sp. PRR65 TaxID=3098148 RepID=UPI002B260EDF|nr:DUF5305 family protein [Halorubellus sp. PRR65]